jgi:hypothetical protein
MANSKYLFTNQGIFNGFEIKYLISVAMFKYVNILCNAMMRTKGRR